METHNMNDEDYTIEYDEDNDADEDEEVSEENVYSPGYTTNNPENTPEYTMTISDFKKAGIRQRLEELKIPKGVFSPVINEDRQATPLAGNSFTETDLGVGKAKRPTKIYLIRENVFGALLNYGPRECTVRTGKKDDRKTPTTNIALLFDEGRFIIHKHFGIGRIIIPTAEMLPEIADIVGTELYSTKTQPHDVNEEIVFCVPVGVEFAKAQIEGHNCNGRGITKYCLWVDDKDIIYLQFSNLSKRVMVGKFRAALGERIRIKNRDFIKWTNRKVHILH
jgi:hypothetical protein